MRRRSLQIFVIGVLFLSVGVGTVAADAPDCRTVPYNGDGTTSSPYEVGNVDELQCIEEQGLGANYVQVSDIDASGTASWNGGKGFDPIGQDPVLGTNPTRFGGTFDGADHTISGLTIDRRSTDFVGLFAGMGGRLENVSLENVNITGKFVVGGLVGDNRGDVRDSYATGDISGGNEVGGLVGINRLEGTVERSYATADVSTSEEDSSPRFGEEVLGGLVGGNDGAVRDSYATGDVSEDVTSDRDGDIVGGLVGGNGLGTVRDSYATGDVSAAGEFSAVGGLVGENSATVERSYATGEVSGTDEVGGLVGDNSGGGIIITDSYWDTETTRQSTSAGNALGLNTSEMTGSAATNNMLGFDFTTTWETVTNPDDYPVLAWQSEEDESPEDGVVNAVRSAGDNPNEIERQSLQDAIFEFVAGDGTYNGVELTREGLQSAVFEFVTG